jgi:DNA-binding beta-propeller fold protein YncE
MNLTVAKGELYVADYWNDRIQVFALDGTPRRIIGGTGRGPGRFDAPGGVAVAANGELIVADFHNQRIQRLRPDGGFIAQLGETREQGIGASAFSYPTDVAVGGDGTIFVADGYNDRIQAFGADGTYLRRWGGPFGLNIFGPFNGWFATVTSIAIDRDGNLLVADFYNNRVQKFAPDGTFLTGFGGKGDGPGQFNHAIAVAAAEDGSVFVADLANNRIQKWRPRANE